MGLHVDTTARVSVGGCGVKVTYTGDGVHLDVVNLVRQDGGLIVAQGAVAFDRCSDTVTAHPIMSPPATCPEERLRYDLFWDVIKPYLSQSVSQSPHHVHRGQHGGFTGAARVLVVVVVDGRVLHPADHHHQRARWTSLLRSVEPRRRRTCQLPRPSTLRR